MKTSFVASILPRFAIILLALNFAGSASAQTHPQHATNTGLVLRAPITLVLAPGEPQPVREAANDLASDMQKVFGTKPTIAGQPAASGTAIEIGAAGHLPEAMRPADVSAPESFSIAVKDHTVVLAGADMRGTIYAIYQFSQDYLGVDPLYYWTDHEPARRASIPLPAGLAKAFPPPVFRYRGFFINDEDLLTGWAPGEKKDHTGISLAAWNKVYETILRLKGNMIVPGTWIFPDNPPIKLAGERGLIVTQHHAIPLGLNVARWPRDVPYNYSEHPEILQRAWKNAVAEYDPNQEILWDVGLRGLSDVSYASMDPSVRNNDKALGELISKAIRDQMSIVRAVHPDAKFVTDLWQEGARLAQAGYLTIPPDVMTVWADDGSGFLQDKGQVKSGEGMYNHIAMLNGRANQLSEMVPVSRTDEELRRYIRAGATSYMLVNTSDIRPVTMSARAIMDLAWQGKLMGVDDVDAQPDQAADKFYRAWATEQFGARAASAIADMYRDYFAAPATYGDPAHEYGDQLYHDESRLMMLTQMIDSPLYAIPSQSPKWEVPRLVGEGFGRPNFGGKDWLKTTAAREVQKCNEAQPRWDAVWKKAQAAEALVAPERKQFYQGAVLTMIAINRESNRMMGKIAQSILDLQNGNTEQARADAAQAMDAVRQAHQAETAAEYGKWKNWYRGDWLTGVPLTEQIIASYQHYLQDPLASTLPSPILWNGWQGYYHIMHYEGDRSADVH
ncbi:MAG TPA: glycosyl hydrolase 115 family protein [Acidobacteriaceae bacterium]|nr:glycosyl hydrolase 115 family protein [Acidobacteriaceae bacterium]